MLNEQNEYTEITYAKLKRPARGLCLRSHFERQRRRERYLRQRIRHLKKIVAAEQAHEMNLDGFLALVRCYTADFAKLTLEMTNEFIEKVVVHHRQKEQGVMQQQVGCGCDRGMILGIEKPQRF